MNKSNKEYYFDWRLKDVCAFCGDFATTEDHVPSRCFLDKPLPKEPPVVPCCEKCNKSFSVDEEYVSCLIDCMKEGTTDPECIKREKTRKTLLHSPMLADRVERQHRWFGGVDVWDYEKERFHRVIRKLALGHLAYFNEKLDFDSNYKISMKILDKMSKIERSEFEKPYCDTLLPEVGSRALQKFYCVIIEDGENKMLIQLPQWQIVQKGRYRYCTSNEGDKVKFVIAEYLAVEVELHD